MALKKLFQGTAATGAGTTAYTVPSGYKCTVTEIDISNTTAAIVTCAAHLPPAGVAVGATNILLPTINIPANTLVQWTGGALLSTGDFIQLIAGAAGITVTLYGNEERQ